MNSLIASANLQNLSLKQKDELASLLEAYKYRWSLHARDKQKLPEGDWTYWLIKAGRGNGKMIDINTEIRTIEGWKYLSEITDNDFVFNLSGKPVKVLKAHNIQEAESYELTFDTGEKIKACADHLWYTVSKIEDKRIRRGKATEGSVKSTFEIVNTLKYKIRETNHRIPIANPIILPKRKLPIEPYLLGIWLGDGASATGEITCADLEILSNIEKLGYNVRHRNDLQYTINVKPSMRDSITGKFIGNGSFHSILKSLNLLKNKHIPEIYLNASIDQRMELLRGLMDSDGYCEKTGWCELVTINKQLSNDYFELISSLGIKCKMYDSESRYYGKLKGRKYRLFFKTAIPVFKLSRKYQRQMSATQAQMSRQNSRFIVDAKKVGKTKMRCLTVDSYDGLFLIGKPCIATHNTRTGSETVRIWKENYPIINLVGATSSAVRDIMIEGESGILNVSPPWDKPVYNSSAMKLTWKNGAIAKLFSAEEPDRLRGPQCYKAWADELAAWRYEESWIQLKMGLRLGNHPQCIITTTPRPTKIIKEIASDKNTFLTHGTSYENRDNLAPAFFDQIIKMYEGTRLGRQELNAEILEDIEGALWTSSMIESTRVQHAPPLSRIVVAVDPSVTSNPDSDECGIIVAGKTENDHAYILEDFSGIYSPDTWARKAVFAYEKYEANRMIAEVNQGGDLVENNIRTVSNTVSYKSVRAYKGKFLRAEPVAAMYEQGRVHHVGTLSKLEDQLTGWNPTTGERSPDRLDALVYAVTELLIEKKNIGGF